MRLRVNHTTTYRYPVTAIESHNEARLMPVTDSDQTCLEYSLTTTPSTKVFSYNLPSGTVHHFELRPPHKELIIRSEALVVTNRTNPFADMKIGEVDDSFYSDPVLKDRYCEYLMPTHRVQLHAETDRIAAVARRQMGSTLGNVSFLLSLNRVLHRILTFKPGVTNVGSTIMQVLEHRAGVCQDFSHLMLAICRRQGIPARYVSGYLYTGEFREGASHASGSQTNSVEITGGDFGENRFTGESGSMLLGADAMHAWVECLLPDGKWHGFDPTNNLLTNHHYIKVHFGRDYGDVAPLRGIYRGPLAHSLDVAVHVSQV